MNFIPNKKKLIISIISTLILILIILITTYKFNKFKKEFEESIPYFKGMIEPHNENEAINAENSTLLMRYYYLQGEEKKSKFWNQSCLFYNFKHCTNLSYKFGLREQDEAIRKFRYENNVVDYQFLFNDKSISTEERECYLLYYKTQDNFLINKNAFLSKYNSCKFYYYKNITELKNHEKQFLDIFK